ncbi:biofilm PGA synthesis protein PgaA, partial [cyanobacterium G8-9]
MRNALSQRFSRAVNTYELWAKPQRESARRLVSFVRPSGLVLDLGCGTGFVSEELEECVPVGLDLSPEMVRAYRSKFGRGVVGRAESLPFKSKSFDFVLSNFALHWGDWERALREALRVARRA